MSFATRSSARFSASTSATTSVPRKTAKSPKDENSRIAAITSPLRRLDEPHGIPVEAVTLELAHDDRPSLEISRGRDEPIRLFLRHPEGHMKRHAVLDEPQRPS